MPQAPHQLHGFGQSELLAREALHETPAAHLAAQLLLPIDPHQIAPGDRDTFALEQSAKDHAVAGQEPACRELDDGVRVFGRRERESIRALNAVRAPAEGRPAARWGERSVSRGAPAPARRRDQSPQSPERVAGDQSVPDELHEAHLEVGGKQPGGALEILREAGAPRGESVEEAASVGGNRLVPGIRFAPRRQRAPGFQILTRQETDRRGPDGRVPSAP
jgi:hypothetical protein